MSVVPGRVYVVTAKKSGVTVKDMYWTLGQYDVIAICEAPDDEAANRAFVERLLARQRTLRDPARLLIRRDEDDPR